MILKTPIVFNTLEELQEAVDLGLKHKSLYLDKTYSLPMIQGINHTDHDEVRGGINIDKSHCFYDIF